MLGFCSLIFFTISQKNKGFFCEVNLPTKHKSLSLLLRSSIASLSILLVSIIFDITVALFFNCLLLNSSITEEDTQITLLILHSAILYATVLGSNAFFIQVGLL